MGAIRGFSAVVGVAMVLIGLLFFCQGLNIVRWPSTSFMLGDTDWSLYGALIAAGGALLIWFARKR